MPTIPEFGDEKLAKIARALLSRSRAIKYHASGWNIKRQCIVGEPERLNVDANGFHGQLRLSVWADRVLWFRLCSGRAKNGWDFMLSFHGNSTGVSGDELADQFIESLSHTPQEELLSIWRNVAPRVERLEPGVLGRDVEFRG